MVGRLAEEYASPDAFRWINSSMVGFLGSVIMASIRSDRAYACTGFIRSVEKWPMTNAKS